MKTEPISLPIRLDKDSEASYEAIVFALFETYECIYVIDAETSAYRCHHESGQYSELKLAGSGEDFFASLISDIPKVIYPEDREYVLGMLRRDVLLAALKKDKYYSFVYRLMLDGKPVYHKVRATMGTINGRAHVLIGVRDVDETIRQEKVHTEALASMYQKEKNHMEAILGSAAGYLEVNLTRDELLDFRPYLPSGESLPVSAREQEERPSSYSEMNRWLCEKQVVENRERYARVSDREYLLECFSRGEKRASVSFSLVGNGSEQPCREVFYLYRDDSSGDVMSFSVVYDLTEQQKKEKELADLETALQMSRIRNFTSQMQPHFLYNALGSIQEVVLSDPEYASELIGDFTVHLRSCIRAMANDSPIDFEQELENIRAYVNIEKMRFGEKLRVRYDIGTADFMIIPLSVQPLVENAIRHGVYQRGPKGGTVVIRTREEKALWAIEVEDDGVGFDVEMQEKLAASGRKDSTGLNNIRFRLDKVMNASLEIESVPGTGTKVRITIPKGGAS